MIKKKIENSVKRHSVFKNKKEGMKDAIHREQEIMAHIFFLSKLKVLDNDEGTISRKSKMICLKRNVRQ